MISHLRLTSRIPASLLLLLVPLCDVRAQEDARPQYMGRTIAPIMTYHGAPWLLRETREKEEATDEMLEALDLKPGQIVCDFGCGNGYHALRFAAKIGPTGKCYGADLQDEMLTELEERAAEEGLSNIETIKCDESNANLPTMTFDIVFLCDVYHELSDPEAVLRQIRQSLKPEGLLVLVEFREEDPSVPIKPLHKMSKAQVEKELAANGFRLQRSYDKLPWQHMLFFAPAEAAQ